MTTCVIVGQNYPDSLSDQLVNAHDRTFIFEPLEDAWLACRERYKDAAEVYPFACGSSYYTTKFHRYNINGLSSSIGKASSAMVEKYSRFNLKLQAVTDVRVVNLYQWLTDRKINEVDNLFIDAQGMDLTILKTMEPMIARSNIGFIQAEADGDGIDLYEDLPDNSVEGFVEFMSQFPEYKFSKVPGCYSWNPDLQWELQSS
jgi:FkbM family methyltransferase